MYAVRLFCVRHAPVFEKLYGVLERVSVAMHPLFSKIGYNRLEAPVAAIESLSKGLLFDCKMCGQCVLSSTGMSCPMNCPKNLRNGPCGGVRPGGLCEVNAQMRCVWVEAWNGASKMTDGLEKIAVVQPPVDRELKGSSSWLRVVREKGEQNRNAKSHKNAAKSQIAKSFSKAREIEPGVAPLAKEPSSALAEQAVKEQTSILTASDERGASSKGQST